MTIIVAVWKGLWSHQAQISLPLHHHMITIIIINSPLARSLCRYHHHHCDSNRGSMERPMVPPGSNTLYLIVMVITAVTVIVAVWKGLWSHRAHSPMYSKLVPPAVRFLPYMSSLLMMPVQCMLHFSLAMYITCLPYVFTSYNPCTMHVTLVEEPVADSNYG